MITSANSTPMRLTLALSVRGERMRASGQLKHVRRGGRRCRTVKIKGCRQRLEPFPSEERRHAPNAQES